MYMRMRRAHRLTGVVSNFLLQFNEGTSSRIILISANVSKQRICGGGDDERAHHLPERRGTAPVAGISTKLPGSHKLRSTTQKIRVLGFTIAMLCGGCREGTLLMQFIDISPNHKMWYLKLTNNMISTIHYYRAGLKCGPQVARIFQASLGRSGKQEQEQN